MRAVLRSQPSWPVQHCVRACTSSKLVKGPLCRPHYPAWRRFLDRRVLRSVDIGLKPRRPTRITGCNTLRDRAGVFVTLLMNGERELFRLRC